MAVVSTQDGSLAAADVESLYRTHASELVRLATLATGDRAQAPSGLTWLDVAG